LKESEIFAVNVLLMERESVVLIVDDDENDVLLMERALKKASIFAQVMVARDGQEAIGYLSGEGKYGDRKVYPMPNLMLLDLKMPIVDGFEVLAWCREQGREWTMPIVVTSSSNHEGDIARAMALGATAYKVKSCNFQYLVAVAKDLGLSQTGSCADGAALPAPGI
jgi:CheY-like chemotaxis protein